MRWSLRTACLIWLFLTVSVAQPLPAHADQFVYLDQRGEKVEVEARLVSSEKQMFVIELDDGEYRIIPQQAVIKRTPGEGPTPVTPAALLSRLEKKFGSDLFRGYRQDHYVLGIVLAEPLPKGGEARATHALRQSATYLRSVDAAFGSFARDLQLPVKQPTHPLVVLIFETDEVFEKYAREIIQGQNLSPGAISGFYTGLTNILAIRMSECFTFEVPLHEAIHQLVYNRHIFQRLAPIPHWFDEGIATGFEGNKTGIRSGPTRVVPKYARQALAARVLSWEQVLTDDRVFTGDVLAGEAYGYAWAMHWLLVTKYRNQYGKYVRRLAEKTALAADSPELRLEEFRSFFGDDLRKLQQEFRGTLETAMKRQKISLSPSMTPGILQLQQNLAQVEIKAVRRLDQEGQFEAQGRLLNVSPLRPMCFLVTIETDGGLYSHWVVPEVAMRQTADLRLKQVEQPMANAGGRPSNSFRVRVRCTPAGSAVAERWCKGEVPVPVFRP